VNLEGENAHSSDAQQMRQEIHKQIIKKIQGVNFEKGPCSLFKAAGVEVREETSSGDGMKHYDIKTTPSAYRHTEGLR
jgi:hypothetical protein